MLSRRVTPSRFLPRIGVWCSTQTFAKTPFHGVARFVEDIEALGYRMLWIPESFGREVMSHAALLLSCSSKLIVGTGIANIWARDPVAMQNGARTIADAYPDRFVLGIGISHSPNVAGRGQQYGKPLQTTRRYIEAMDAARWDGPAVAPPPMRLVGALGPAMLALSAELADGAHPYLVTPEHTRQARGTLGPDAVLAPEQSVILEPAPAVARAAGRHHLAHYLDRTNYRNSFLRQGFEESDLEDGGSDRLIDSIIAHGTAEEAASRVRQHLDAGADHVAVQVVAGDLSKTALALAELAPALLPEP
jgi:probable F420-dependent oxidoreductase